MSSYRQTAQQVRRTSNLAICDPCMSVNKAKTRVFVNRLVTLQLQATLFTITNSM
jgi:hypothetical protein